MLKPIPQEAPDKPHKPCARKRRNIRVPNQKKVLNKVQKKMNAAHRQDKSLLQKVCIRLLKFIRNPDGHNDGQITDLIHNMQRSVLTLERERRKKINRMHAQKRA